MKVQVSGQFRYDVPGHTEQGLQDYAIEFEIENFHRGDILVEAAKLLKKENPAFDSLRTHAIEVVE